MGKRRKRQTINFPTQDTTTDSELNAVVDGEQVRKSKSDRWQENAEQKVKEAAAVSQIPEIFRPDQVEFVFDVLALVLSFIYSQLLKYDFNVIYAELSFDKEQKEKLSIPLARICSKYAPSEWAGMTAEIELVMVLGIWAVAGFGRARLAVQKDKDQKLQAAQQRRNPVTQMPQQDREEVSAIPL